MFLLKAFGMGKHNLLEFFDFTHFSEFADRKTKITIISQKIEFFRKYMHEYCKICEKIGSLQIKILSQIIDIDQSYFTES